MDQIIDQLSFQEDGLIPAIVQDVTTKDVLMMAYMNEQSLRKTIETKEAWFYSRSRQELWHKGATSGNTQTVKQLTYDCDGDALLVLVDPAGPACHTGEVSCFYNNILKEPEHAKRDIIPKLVTKIEKRKQEQADGSYTTYLFKEGIDKVLKKIGEESSEIIIAAKNDDHEELVWEIADFIYHLFVLMNIKNVELSHIYEELTNRFSK